MSYLKRGIAVLLAAGLVVPAAYSHVARVINNHNRIHGARHTPIQRLNAIIDHNSTKTQVSPFNWMNRITIGGLMNVDAVEEQRGWNVTGPATAGTIPNFRTMGSMKTERASDITINNANLLVDARVNRWVKVHLGAVYRDIPGPLDPVGGVDEAYITVANLARSPFYFRAGRVYVPIGSYEDPYPLTVGLVQLLTQTNATVLQVGYASTACGMYGTAYMFNSPFSGHSIYTSSVSDSYGLSGSDTNLDHLPRATRVRNFGAKIGYRSHYRGYHYNLEASYLKDFRDTAFFLANEFVPTASQSIGSRNALGLRRAGVYELHAYVKHSEFDFLADYVALARRLDISDAALNPIPPDDVNTRMWAYSVRGGYWFTTYGRRSKVQLAYERAGHTVLTSAASSSYQGVSRLNPARYTPRFRYIVDYIVNMGYRTSLTLQYTYAKDFPPVMPDSSDDYAYDLKRGSARTIKARLSVAF